MGWKRPLSLLGVLLVMAPTTYASAQTEPMVFARVDDLSSLDAQRFYGSYAFETGRRFLADGETQQTSLKHRFSLAYGILPSLQLSVMQVVKHNVGQKGKPGVFSPQLRLGFGPLLPSSVGSWPQGLSLFFAPRVRTTGRRDHGLVFGIGTRTQPIRRPDGRAVARDWVVTANAGLEATVPQGDNAAEVGLRWDAGFGYQVLSMMLIGVETWGHASWAEGDFLEQEHAFGPTVSLFFGPVRLGINASVWLRDFANGATNTDLRGTFNLAMTL